MKYDYDMIVTTPGLQVRTMKSMLQYLEDDLKTDREDWKKLNPTIIAEFSTSILFTKIRDRVFFFA